MPQSAHQWAVAELKRLKFDGDCDALAQYVEALIDNNRETEDGNPSLLRRQVKNDLVDFIGEDSAVRFVNALIRYLSKLGLLAHDNSSPPSSPSKIQSASQPSQPTPAKVSQASVPQSSQSPRRPSPSEQAGRQNAHQHANAHQGQAPQPDRSRHARSPRPHPRDHRDNPSHDRQRERTDRDWDRDANHRQDRYRDRDVSRHQSHHNDANTSARAPRQSVIARLGGRDDRVTQPAHHSQPGPYRGGRSDRDYNAPSRAQASPSAGSGPAQRRTSGEGIQARLGQRVAKRGRDDADDVADDHDPSPTKVARRSSDDRRRSDGADPSLQHQNRDRRSPDRASPGGHNNNKNPRGESFSRAGNAPQQSWPVPPGMMKHLFPPPPFPFPPPFGPNAGSNGMGEREQSFRSAQGGRGGMGRGGNIRGNGVRGSGGRGGFGTGSPSGASSTTGSGRFRHFILLARNIPEDKMMIGPIMAFFLQFGNVLDVVRAPPDRAFVLFEERGHASAALNSVDAIMGNRHIRLAWARDPDFAEAGLSLSESGKLVSTTEGTNAGVDGTVATGSGAANARKVSGPYNGEGGKGGDDGGEPNLERGSRGKYAKKGEFVRGKGPVGAKTTEVGGDGEGGKVTVVDEKAAAEDLRRKKEKITAMRKEQEARRTQRLARYNELVNEQKQVFLQVKASKDKSEKNELMKKIRKLQEDAMNVRNELNPPVGAKAKVAGGENRKVVQATTSPVGPGKGRFGRNISSFQVDNRPKNLLVTGAMDVSVGAASGVFRETVRAVKVEEGWLIEMGSRRAAESAVRAIGPMRRGFGMESNSQIVASSLPGAQTDGGNGKSNGNVTGKRNRDDEVVPQAKVAKVMDGGKSEVGGGAAPVVETRTGKAASENESS